MIRMLKETLTIPIEKETDILIIGGGIAGIAAALAARRNGANVLLLEKSALFGGLATTGLVNWYEPLCDGHGEQLIYGIAEELLRLSIRYGDDTLPAIWRDSAKPVNKALLQPEKQHAIGGRYATFFSPTLFQLALDELLEQEGISIRLDILAAQPLMQKGHCLGISCESKSGRSFFPAKVIIDASGDADMLCRAGVPCIEGENYFSFIAHMCDLSEKEKALEQRRWITAGANLFGNGQPQEECYTPCLTNEQITRFLLRGRKALLEKLKNQKRGTFDITALPQIPQCRKTRRLAGTYTLHESDKEMNQKDSVGLAADFERPGDWYEIPWGCLYHRDCRNILAAGRMISSEGWAWDVTRVIPVCALTGQAAGTAAALMAQNQSAAASLSVAKLQAALIKQGVRLHKKQG